MKRRCISSKRKQLLNDIDFHIEQTQQSKLSELGCAHEKRSGVTDAMEVDVSIRDSCQGPQGSRVGRMRFWMKRESGSVLTTWVRGVLGVLLHGHDIIQCVDPRVVLQPDHVAECKWIRVRTFIFIEDKGYL